MWRPRWPFRQDKDTELSVSEPDISPDTDKVPWWVSVFTDWGRPLAAVVVLVLCAPGEQHLAHLAGWSYSLSWGMAGLFSMYAGIAAVVATVRPKGAPGKKSAVCGAVLSLLLAMGAQPVSHLFVTGWLSAEPRAPWTLVAAVSCVPPFILGHLLHLAASPSRPVRPARSVRPDIAVSSPVPSWVTEEKARRSVPDKPVRPAPVPVPVPAPVSGPVSLDKQDSRPAGQPGPAATLADKQNMSARAFVLASSGQDKDSIKDTLRAEYPKAKADSVRKAADRALGKVSRAS